jgi:shikimate dehydrogenase
MKSRRGAVMSGSLRLAVTGNPIMQSLSPVIFEKIFSKTGLNGFYIRIMSDSIEETVKAARIISLDGLNITSPFKSDAGNIADEKNDVVKLLNACNTMTFKGGRLQSFNTDPQGVLLPVLKKIKDPSGKKAVVIGAGGAGIAACYALSSLGFRTVLVNRTLEKGREKTAAIKNCSSESLDKIDEVIKDASVVIHSLPVPEYFFNPEKLNSEAVLFDANYKYSPLKKIAREKGLDYIDGREWLLGQAEEAFRIFSSGAGKLCGEAGEEGSTILSGTDFTSSPCFKNISLIGFMGSGKTATGKHLSSMTGWDFIDTDSVIEKKAGMRINDIFQQKGESYFRKMERDVLISVLSEGNKKIISCGGGVVEDSIIREKLKEMSLPVWLLSSPEVSLKRITDNSRPLLNSPERNEKALSIFNRRIDLYGKTAELLINTEVRDGINTARRLYEEICEYL